MNPAVVLIIAALVLSGCPSPFYYELFGDWCQHRIETATGNGTVGSQARTEVVEP